MEQFNSIFESALLEELEEQGTLLSVKRHEVILDIGETIRQIPIILSGTVKVSRINEEGNEIFLYYVSPNQSCAMTFTCCMQRLSSEIKAVAEEDVELLNIPINHMDRWMRTYPTWNSFVMTTIRERFNELLQTIDQIAFQKLDERLINYLKEKVTTGQSSLLKLSHGEIAVDLATSREVISRLLKSLERDNKVLLYRNEIRVLGDL